VIKRLILVAVLLGLVFGAIFGWKFYQSHQATERASQPKPPATVSSAPVQEETWQPTLHSVGSLVASEGVFVTNEIEGQVREIQFESGQAVAQGDVLVRLNDSVEQADLLGLIAEGRLAELRYQRLAKLLKDKSVSRSEYDEAEANLQAAQSQMAAKQALIQQKRIRAPFAGLLGIRRVDLGQYLAPGAEIVSLQALDPIYVDYLLPERHFARISRGQEVLVRVQAYPGVVFKGRILAISSRIETRTRNIRVRATLQNRDRRLRPGMFAEVHTQLPERKAVLTLPRIAITYTPYGDSVFVIEDSDQGLVVRRRQVQTGAVQGGRVEILEGLGAGERVVSAGQVKLRNGQRIRIDDSVALPPGVETP